jgi:hypothetical protein
VCRFVSCISEGNDSCSNYIGEDHLSPAHSGIIHSVDIYTATTVLLGAQMCKLNVELESIDVEWHMALDYVKVSHQHRFRHDNVSQS